MTSSAPRKSEAANNQDGDERLDDLLALFATCDSAELMNAREREHRNQVRGLLIDLLGVADALHELERHCAQLKSAGDSRAPRKSVELVRRMLMRVLKSQHVVPMKCKGYHVDLERHKVVEVKHVPETPDDVVLHENLQGYMWQDSVLRAAEVVVSGVHGVKNNIVAGRRNAPRTDSAQSK